MAKEDTLNTGESAFSAAKAAFSLYGGFFQDVVQEIGLEKALSLHAKQAEAFDAVLSGTVRERLGDKQIDLNTFASVRAAALGMLGMAIQTEEAPNSVRLRVGRCPLYEGLRAAGAERATIQAMCGRGVDLGYARLTEAFPQLSGVLQFRLTPDQPCVDEFTLSDGPV